MKWPGFIRRLLCSHSSLEFVENVPVYPHDMGAIHGAVPYAWRSKWRCKFCEKVITKPGQHFEP
jgi:hypothetical protein